MDTKRKILIKKILTEALRKEAIREAEQILMKASKEDVDEFVGFYKRENWNLVCMSIDVAKWHLVKAGKMKQKKNDEFGQPFG